MGYWSLIDLAISGAILFNNPTSFGAKGLEYFIIITVFRELVISLSSKTGVNLGGYGSSPSLSSLVVLSLLPRRLPPSWWTTRRHCSSSATGKHLNHHTAPLSLSKCVYYCSCWREKWLNWDMVVTRTTPPRFIGICQILNC